MLLVMGLCRITCAQELKRIRLGYPSLSMQHGHIWVAKEEGLFKKHGLDVEPVFLRGGQMATQALVGGDPPLASIGSVIQPSLQGHNLVLFAAVENKYDMLLYARPEITRLDQLKGKRFGITGFGAASYYGALVLLKHANLEPVRDVALVPAGVDAERIAGITSGRIDVSFFSIPAIPHAKKAGLVQLFDMADLDVEVQGNGFATSRSFIKSRRDLVKSALKGYVEGIHFIYHNKEATKKHIAKYLRAPSPEILEDSYAGYIRSTPRRPFPTLKGIQFMLDMLTAQMPQAKSAKPEQFVDLSFLQELEKEGFFAEMGKRYPAN